MGEVTHRRGRVEVPVLDFRVRTKYDEERRLGNVYDK